MKIFLTLCAVVALCSSVVKATEEETVYNFNMNEELSPEDRAKLKELVDKEKKRYELSELRAIDIEALVNDYLDKVLANVRELIIANNGDPLLLGDQIIDIGIGQTNLTDGELNDTATIQRFENATVHYNSGSENLTIEMVVGFEDLNLFYNYDTLVSIINLTGELHGTIENIHIHVKLGFDFADSLVFVDTIDFKHTGDIEIWFTGNDLVDWITNAMSAVITGLLHDVILDIVKDIVADPINQLVDAINQALHPTTTTTELTSTTTSELITSTVPSVF